MWEIGFIAIALVIGLFCGATLYSAALRDHRNRWVWGVVGLLTNVIGLLVYRLAVGRIIKN